MVLISLLRLLTLAGCISVVRAKSLWSTVPAEFGSDDAYILKTGYFLGNGKLGAIPFGPPGAETLVLNLDTLWSGGPFANSSYRGGNPTEEVSEYLPGIREWIFQNGTGNISQLLGSSSGYGSYQVLANLSIAFSNVGDYADYKRTLDLATGVHTSSWTSNGSTYSTSVFCSYPAQSCIYRVEADGGLSPITVGFQKEQVDATLINATCGIGFTRLTGLTQADIGMNYNTIAKILGDSSSTCSSETGVLTVTPEAGQKSVTLVWSAESDYNATKGNAQNHYSFRGEDPGHIVESTTSEAVSQTFDRLLDDHTKDYSTLFGSFALNLPDTANSSAIEISELIDRYTANGTADPYLESLIFDYSRHLLISSSRDNSLPANLQGRWTEQISPAWSGDYHSNINIQMNYWGADQTGLGSLSRPLFHYLTNTWVPRGTETAQLLYNGSGWVTHNEMNIFGHTGMKEDAQWANYPISNAWMMLHVFDHFDYNCGDVAWLTETGYPLLRGVASFWLSQLEEDFFYNDGTLVVNNCNSAEHGSTTFGCTHYQQLIRQVFDFILTTAPLVSENNTAFLNTLSSSLEKLDAGIHIDAATGVIKEWKVPDSYLYNLQAKHRHLSHLIGWFPGSTISSYADGYTTNTTIQDAVRASLIERGDGTDADNGGTGNYGWPKVWRGACWARLNDSANAYNELRLAIQENMAPNLLSMYSGRNPPFQIDMNFGFSGNVLSMLVVDLPLSAARRAAGEVRTVVLGPAIPTAWAGGSVRGLRLRGGGVVDFEWDDQGLVTTATVSGGTGVRVVNKEGTEL